ncbi:MULTISPECIES: undecaprenyl-diphosphate phosphatase [unclassified Sphingobium]|uniref:undecaprenyl-diphosphate phosphatase n=1 Tax=unclassified Sphingobium TaxID=2611147 RepID=UPI002224178C|nr:MULTISPECIES: undecaprenyl-diphosphate phosphatase [unclassified Sphingobium]MCW2413165.1 undecaprenyl-diphosphatase [Sphingobium sp. B8D3D]MCW2414537.1 undecaprenyl-diphosphatase [Sphingobium sp. B8D3A]
MDSNVFTAILLGILEGLTEFLPVSSTGHLILASELLGFTGESSVTFKIAIQFGAILAVMAVYWQRFWGVGTGLLKGRPDDIAFTRNVFLGFAPALVIGVLAYEAVRAAIQTPMIVAVALIIGGILMLILERMVKTVRVKSVETMPFTTALGIGLMQCIAMIPGVSRSGATILGALTMGVDRKTAAEYSFFLAVPTMLAATVYALWKDRALLNADDLGMIAIGFGMAFLTALFVVKGFVAVVTRYGFKPFAWYRIIAGSIALIALLMR